MARKKRKTILRPLSALLVLILLFWFYRSHEGRAPLSPSPDKQPPPQSYPTASSPSERESGTIPSSLRFADGHPKDFDQAKRILKNLYPRGRELYCDCPFDLSAKTQVDYKACGFKPKSARGHKIEWEHVVPASVFGHHFKEWKEGAQTCADRGGQRRGRSCARDASPVFRQMEADLYNLLPAIGELNRARANFPYAEIAGEERRFGGCDFEVHAQLVEPRPEIRGDVARIYFYMDARYPGFDIVTPQLLPLLSAWAAADPLDKAEIERLRAIEAIQGNSFFIGRLSQAKPAAPGR